MSRPLDRCGQEGHDRLADRLSQEVAGIKERVLPRVILIGKMAVVVIARSWSLDDSAAGMDGARLAGERGRRPRLIRIGGLSVFFNSFFSLPCILRPYDSTHMYI
jgi:hypothetical protein